MYIIKQILTIQAELSLYDSSVCGYEHFVCIDDLRIWAFVKNKKQQVQIGEIICH